MRLDWYDKQFLKLLDKKLEIATRNGAEEVADEMRRRCPVSRFERAGNKYGNRPGTLRDSIRVKKSRYPEGGHMVLIGGKGPWGDAFYASFVIFGTAYIDKNLFPHKALAAKRGAIQRQFDRVDI
jgi:HK97 gp10 family phage protein